MKRIVIEGGMIALLFLGVFMLSRYRSLMAAGYNVKLGKEKPIVVLDAGHGASHLCK